MYAIPFLDFSIPKTTCSGRTAVLPNSLAVSDALTRAVSAFGVKIICLSSYSASLEVICFNLSENLSYVIPAFSNVSDKSPELSSKIESIICSVPKISYSDVVNFATALLKIAAESGSFTRDKI